MTTTDRSEANPGIVRRLPLVNRHGMPAEDQAAVDYMADTHGGKIDGPFSVLAHVPELGATVAHVEACLRNAPDVPRAERELVTLATVREAKARFGWSVHERGALAAGVRPEAIEILRSLGPLENLLPRERLLVEIARSLTRTRVLPDELYARAVAELGEQTLIKFVVLVGHYSLIGLVLNSFQVPPPVDGPAPGF